jgi:predicted membrane-bound spermidine synthase
MANSERVREEGGDDGVGRPETLQAAVFLVCFSLIAFEIAISRLLSVLLSHHYVFVVLSFALLGLGLGGLLARFLRPRDRDVDGAWGGLALVAAMLSGSITISVLAVIALGSDERIPTNVLLHGFLLLIPFVLAGSLLAEIYRRFPAVGSRTYGADLIGAAAGSFGAVLLLDVLGGIAIHFALGVVGAVASLVLASGGVAGHRKGLIAPGLALLGSCAFLGATLVGLYRPEVPIGRNPTKEIHDALASFKGKIVETRWSAFGRTDLVSFGDHPDHMDIYLDGTAGSPMYRFSGDMRDPGPAIEGLKADFPGYFPFIHLRDEEKDSALVIGPGGGRDILLALMAGVRRIVAVEVNEDLVDLVGRYSWFNGGIYTGLGNVQIVVDEGRNFLQRQKEQYDVILLSLPVTNTSRSVEGYSLTENFLFTTDSLLDYLDHLTDEGRLVAVGHNDAEILRLLSISVTALNRRGIGSAAAMGHLYVVGS